MIDRDKMGHEEMAFLMDVIANGARLGKTVNWALAEAKLDFEAEAESEGPADNGFQLWAISIIDRALDDRKQAGRDE